MFRANLHYDTQGIENKVSGSAGKDISGNYFVTESRPALRTITEYVRFMAFVFGSHGRCMAVDCVVSSLLMEETSVCADSDDGSPVVPS